MHELSDVWVFLTAAGTIAMAVTTGMVIKQTKRQIVDSERLIADTERQLRQSERQHHDAYMPVLVIEPHNIQCLPSRTNEILKVASDSKGAYYILCGIIENLGPGIALDATVSFWFPSLSNYITVPVKIPPVGSKARYGTPKGEGYTNFNATLEGSFNEQTFLGSEGDSWKIVIEYSDIFGNNFHTIHHKNPQFPWAEFVSGKFTLSRRVPTKKIGSYE